MRSQKAILCSNQISLRGAKEARPAHWGCQEAGNGVDLESRGDYTQGLSSGL